MTIPKRVLLSGLSLIVTFAASSSSVHAASTALAVTAVTSTQSEAISDNTYEHGWKWLFSVTAPADETLLQMKFSDWAGLNGTISATNARYYSAESVDATDPDHAVTLSTANAYGDIVLTIDPSRDLDAIATGTQVQVVVETKVPVSAGNGSYTTSYGIKTVAPELEVVPEPVAPGITVSVSSSSPVSGTLPVYATAHSDPQTILGFRLTNNSDVDADIPSLAFTVSTSSTLGIGNELSALIEKATVTIDGSSYEGILVDSSGRLEFTDIGVFLPAGEYIEGTVSLVLNQQEGNYAAEGGVISVSLLGGTSGAVGSIQTETGDVMPSSGSASGAVHTVTLVPDPVARIEAVSAEAFSTSDGQSSGTTGTYSIKFNLEASGDTDVYVPLTTGTTTGAVIYSVITPQPASFQGSSVSALTSTADRQSGYFVVRAGETKRFTLTVALIPSQSGFYGVGMRSLTATTDPVTPSDSFTLSTDTEDFKTPLLFLSSTNVSSS